MSKLHVVIIDAMNLIRRVHAAQPDTHTLEATTQTCLKTLDKIISHSEPSHIVAIFDHTGQDRGWRADILPEYKQGRKPMPSDLEQGLDTIQDAFWQRGVDSLLSQGDEADDMIATLALKVAAHHEQVTIVSTDKGYCQLLQPTLRVRDYFQHRWLDLAFVEKSFGVRPEQLCDFWGLAGISSSEISGVPGIGPKSAANLLSQYGDLDAILSANDLAEKWAKKLDGHHDLARKCKAVAQLKTDIPLGFNLQDIRFQPTTVSA
ncbi:flap endonuclease Xni [Salinivibrio proteolyticus]|uniref:flap endonuclease Xni n=1 Tax=Salinivibrio proteolyticus TaxID=334715 RepID=UPI000988C04E|nr:flap endonuclease Xni [Salinivibrio proteolyticus]OOF25908.1 flap endonuclease Xni [Salinivibrio proteolyticus]